MSKRAWAVVILCLWTAAAAGRFQSGQGAGKAPVTLTYIANMGVLVGSGDTKVLIDALFDKPNPEYRAPAPEALDKIIKGEAPFDGVKLALVTHNHPDHFAAGVAVRFLESRSERVLVAPADAVAEMRKAASDWTKLEPQVISLDLEKGKIERLKAAGIPITAVRTLHSGDRDAPMNLMYLFEIGGRRIFHEGDSTGKPEVFKGIGLESAPIDLAVVHYWFPLDPNMAKHLQEAFQPDHLALGHLPIRLESDAPGKIDMVRQHYKDIFLLLPGMPDKAMGPESLQPLDILSAVKNGDLDRVRALLKQDPELIRAKDEYKNSLLRVALLENDSTMARLLIESGIDLNYAREDIGGSEIFGAIDVGSFEITKLILEKGADIHSIRRWDNTPLEAAVLGGHKEIAYFLVDKGAALDAQGPKAPRFLRAALGAGMDRITNQLIKVKGVDFGNVNALGDTLLHAAARSGETTFIGLLVEKGLDPNARNVYGWTPLHTAASLGHSLMVETLVKNGADKRARTKDGQTPLNLADALGQKELSAFLKKKGFPAAPPEYPKLSAPYIDPELPGEEPRRFAPGIISQPHHFEHAKLSFTADMTTACWADWQRTGTSKVFVMEKRDGLWQAPRTVLLNATMPFIAPDGKRIFFTAPRVLPDGREAGDSDIYYIQRTEAGWSDRVNLGPSVNTEIDEIQPSVTRDGTVYFVHRADIYRSKVVDGRYAPKERLPAPINDDTTQAQPFIASDGSFLLFLSLGQGGVRDMNNYYSSEKADGTWTEPVNIAKKVKAIGLFPSLTPDNRFMISFEGGDLYWFDIGAVMKKLIEPASAFAQVDKDRVAPENANEARLNRLQPPSQVMDIIGAAPGMTIAEIGAGWGRYVVNLAERVGPNGKVYAEDIDEAALRHCAERCRRNGFDNVETILGGFTDPKLPANVLDLIFVISSYHHFSDPVALMKNARPALKPTGRLAIAEWVPPPGGRGEGTAPETIKTKMEEAGYILERIDKTFENNRMYIYLYRPRTADRPPALKGPNLGLTLSGMTLGVGFMGNKEEL